MKLEVDQVWKKFNNIPDEDITYFEENGVQWKYDRNFVGSWIHKLAEALRSFYLINPLNTEIKTNYEENDYKMGKKIKQARYMWRHDKLTQDQINELTKAGIDWGKKEF